MIDKRKYDGLIISAATQDLLDNDPLRFKSLCNGVGSKVGSWFDRLLYHLTPNTIWFMDITDGADLHDVDYSVPTLFHSIEAALQYRLDADQRFLNNLEIRITERGGLLKGLRLRRAKKYYYLLRGFGEESFMAGKRILEY
ncbi:hypothetical protein P0136_11415 [Lentisphaerota bacterium ZTH]|nr:hypothetical protein JYG24_11065 [Lentisphaerota bacterium]WET05966.1 hypothetical protein P0136_11415 [Lentisphaerota bacterium ZTH]